MKEDPEVVTVGVPTRNRPFYLSILLSSLLSQSFTDWDLIVVNDGDEDIEENHLLKGIFSIIRHKGHKLRIIPGPKAGPGQAHNVILANSQNELIMRVDDDVYLEPRYIEILYEFISKEDGIGGVGGRLLNPKYLNRSPEFPMEWRGKVIFKDGHFIPYEYHRFPPGPDDEPYEVDHLYTHFLYWKRIVEEIGGFPDVYSQMGRREETDTTIRMRMAGYRLYVLPQAIAWHIHSLFGGTRDGIDKSNYQKYLQMEEDDVRLFENRMWKWVSGGFRGFVIPDEKVKLRRLRYLLNKHKRSVREARSINLNEILEVVKLKKECLFRLTDEDMLYLLLFKIMTTAERDEIKGGDRL